jgi:SAM-dependent methyltransferase
MCYETAVLILLEQASANPMSDKDPAEVYEQYLGQSIADPFTRILLKLVRPKPGERVLDLASGTGSVARHVAPLIGLKGRVVALDISPAMLSRPYGNGRWMGLPLVVKTGDGMRDSVSESIGIDKGAVGEVMLLEVAPASFDIVQFGGIFR